MNRKITDFAFAAKCGGFGARGLARVPAQPSRVSRLCSASAPKPCAASSKTLLRERLGNVEELTTVQQRQAEILERSSFREEILCHAQFRAVRRAAERNLICT